MWRGGGRCGEGRGCGEARGGSVSRESFEMGVRSFSRPWKPSTLFTSTAWAPGTPSDWTICLSTATCALYGVTTPTSLPLSSPSSRMARSTWLGLGVGLGLGFGFGWG
eukprot:scaffold95297_cov18-Phaeocystis_antarctica.AAC.1